MKLLGATQNNKSKLIIEGEIISEKDALEFLWVVSKNDDFFDELSFVGTKKLPYEIIKKITKMQQNGTVLYTNKRVLWRYLNSIGIDAIYKNPFNIAQRDIISAVGIGGSAGSVSQIIQIVSGLTKSECSVFIVIHIEKNFPKGFIENLQKNANGYTIKEAIDGEMVEPKTIYVAVADKHLIVENGYIFLTNGEKDSFSRPSINVTFESLAREYQGELVVIVLCGYGDDGSRSLESVKNRDGKIFVVDSEFCDAKDMPKNASKVATDAQIMPLDKIIAKLNEMLSSQSADEISEQFLEDIYAKYGYDFRNYEKKLISRRVLVTKKRVGITKTDEFYEAVLKDKNLFEELFFDFSINVTTFFRDSGVFRTIKDKVLPYLASFMELKIWCAGCSTGEEAYSLAIMLDELGVLEKTIIYATDFNIIKLQEAQNALYSKEKFDTFKKNYILSGGAKKFEDYFEFEYGYTKIIPRIKDKVVFFKHNLVSDGSINEFQLVLCRNVMIYFDETLRKKVFSLIDESLSRNGFLVLGHSEIATDYKIIGEPSYKIYQKKKEKRE